MPVKAEGTSHADQLKRGPFESFKVGCSRLNLTSQTRWLQFADAMAKNPDFKFQWLNTAKTAFQLDALPQNQRLHIMLTMSQTEETDRKREKHNVKVLINGSQDVKLHMSHLFGMVSYESWPNTNGFQAFVDTITRFTEIDAKITRCPGDDCFAQSMAETVRPIPHHIIMNNIESVKEHVKALLAEAHVDEEEEDDFEHVHFDDSDCEFDAELVEEETEEEEDIKEVALSWEDADVDADVAQIQSICQKCGDQRKNAILRTKCGHSYCTECLRSHFYDPIDKKTGQLTCPDQTCQEEYPLSYLASVFPMEMVFLAINSRMEKFAEENSMNIFVCPNGCGVGFMSKNRGNLQVRCLGCNLHYCRECDQKPHWPMTCEQAKEWSEKVKLQPWQSQISASFWEVVDEGRKRRCDAAAWRSIAKVLRKNVNYKLERSFEDLRRAVS